MVRLLEVSNHIPVHDIVLAMNDDNLNTHKRVVSFAFERIIQTEISMVIPLQKSCYLLYNQRHHV